MPGPLAGLRVLELARILAGPWAGQVLADLGADVIKVERSKTGDDTRAWGPPFIEAKDGGHLGAAYFHATNRGKRSIEARFRDRGRQAHRQEARRALRRADRELQGRRARQVRPRLQEPRAGMPAADLLLGHRLRPGRPLCHARRLRPDGAGHGRLHEPHRHGRRRADARRRAGVRHLDRRLFGDRHPRRAARSASAPARAAMSTPRWSIPRSACWPTRALNYLASGKVPERIGNAHPNIVPYQVFPVADGHIIIATGNDSQYVEAVRRARRAGAGEGPELHRQQGAARATAPSWSASSRADDEVQDAGPGRQARSGRRAGRPDQQSRSGVRRSARQASRHEARPAERVRQGRHASPACARRSWSTASRWRRRIPRRGSASTPRRF